MTDPASNHPGALVRTLGKSKRLQYLLKRIAADASLPANPLAWLPILLSGPHPLTSGGLCKSVRRWSRRRFGKTGCEVAVATVEAPPPLLDAAGGGTRGGVTLTVKHAGGTRVQHLQAWIAGDGTRGTYAVFAEGDEAIETHALEPVTDDGEAIGRLDRIASRFIDEQLMAPAFEEWLESYTSDWRWIEPDLSAEIAAHHKGEHWRFAAVPHGRDGTIVLGCSALSCIATVEVGVFFTGTNGKLVQQNHVGYAKSPAELSALLRKNFGSSPTDTVIAAWMLHRAVPPLSSAG